MAEEIFATNWIFTQYILPFLLIFVIIFAILEKTKLFGDEKKQLNAIAAITVALIFTGFLYPKEIVTNLVLFLAVAIVVLLVFLMLYGFVASGKEGFEIEGWLKNTFLGIIAVAVIVAVLWAVGIGNANSIFDFLFEQDWSGVFWTNLVFIIFIVVAIVTAIKSSKGD